MKGFEQIANTVQQGMQKLQQADRVKIAIGMALTQDQQIAVSAKIANGPDAFIAWAATDDGRAAIRELADKFTK
jgi:6,7-dimethyl-8-ribityllumazine synthase